MSITQRGSTTNATTASGNSLSCSKPTGVVSGDVLLALVTSNDGSITSTGWTVIGHGSGQPDLFDATWLYKVAGGSEGSSYTFSNNSGTNPPIVVSITAWTGVDTSSSPIGGSTITGSGSSTEPKSVPGCTNTALALPIYSRSCRVSHSGVSDITTFTSADTELADTGVWSGGSVSYGHGVYMGTEATGNPPSLSITASNSTNESDNVVASLTLLTLITNVSASAGKASVTVAGQGVTSATGIAALPGKASATAAALAPAVITGKFGLAGVATASVSVKDVGRRIATGAASATSAVPGIGAFTGTPAARTFRVPADVPGGEV